MIKDKKSYSKAKELCFHLLKVRPRSEYELCTYLQRKRFTKDVINKTIQYLSGIDLVDDFAFAKAWAESRIKQLKGKTRIRFELIQKGIDSKIINRVSNQVCSSVNEEDTIRSLVEQKMGRLKKLDMDTKKRRIWGFLVRRGFSEDAIMDALSEL